MAKTAFKVRIEHGDVYQNDVRVATVHGGYCMGMNGEFLIRSRKGNGEAKDFAKFMLSRMTVKEVAQGVAISSPVEFGAACGWVMPHFRKWVKDGIMTQEKIDAYVASSVASHNKKAGL